MGWPIDKCDDTLLSYEDGISQRWTFVKDDKQSICLSMQNHSFKYEKIDGMAFVFFAVT